MNYQILSGIIVLGTVPVLTLAGGLGFWCGIQARREQVKFLKEALSFEIEEQKRLRALGSARLKLLQELTDTRILSTSERDDLVTRVEAAARPHPPKET